MIGLSLSRYTVKLNLALFFADLLYQVIESLFYICAVIGANCKKLTVILFLHLVDDWFVYLNLLLELFRVEKVAFVPEE